MTDHTPAASYPVLALAGTELDALVVSCRRCMRPFDDDAENEPCTPVPMP
jgi:hypothetical protein